MVHILQSFTSTRSSHLRKRLGNCFVGVSTLLLVVISPASAAPINYTADSFTDGVTGPVIGGGAFELYGIGYAQQGHDLFVGLNTNLPIGGFADTSVTGGSIAWGDMFFNFSDPALGLTFDEAIQADQVYGIRFDAANDSTVPLGVYQVTETKSVVQTNGGFDSFPAYANAVSTGGGTPSLGVIPLDGSYLSNTNLPQNEIATGNFLGNVTFIDDFSTVGFAPDFGFSTALSQTGHFTYGFKVDSSVMPAGEFVAHVLAECINDGLGFRGELAAIALRPETNEPEAGKTVPEPGGLIGMVIALGVFAMTQNRCRFS